MRMEIFSPNKMKSFSSILMLICFVSACKKSDLDISSDFSTVKIYDDQEANVDNPFTRISATSDGFYMVYGISSYGSMINGNQNGNFIKSRIIKTDKDGNMLWRKTLEDNITIGGVAGLDDGGCLAALGNTWNATPTINNNNIYIKRYDNIGNVIMWDSIPLIPTFGTYPGFYFLNIFKTSQGKFIIYGTVFDYGGSFTISRGFAIEYAIGSGVQWLKQFYFPPGTSPGQIMYITGCATTSDNGFIFSGIEGNLDASGFSGIAQPITIRTNSTGDTLWTRRQSISAGVYEFWGGNVIAMQNGNYKCCYTSNIWANGIDGKIKAHIYEFTINGDSVNQATIEDRNLNTCYSIAETSNGDCLALVNQYPNTINAYYDGLKSMVNTRKILYNANMEKLSDTYFQPLTTDIYFSSCKTSDGRIACFGMQQSVGKSYYVPVLIILNQ